MIVLLIGGNGFLGSHVADAFLANGDQVRILDLRPELYRPADPRISYHLGELDDLALVTEALVGVDICFHMASATVPTTAATSPETDVEANLIRTLRLIGTVKANHVCRFVFFSSGGTVYGIPDVLPIPEEHPLRPMNSYGIVKTAIEHYLAIFERAGELQPVILRISNPYGPRQGHLGVQGVISTFLARVRLGESLEIWGDGSVVRDYLYVTDLADLCVRVAHSDFKGVLNVGSGKGVALNEVVDLVRETTGLEVKTNYKEGRLIDVPVNYLDVAKAERVFGWRPKVELRSGLRKTWRWMQGNE